VRKFFEVFKRTGPAANNDLFWRCQAVRPAMLVVL